jgi:GNAT superfamily N-acetyltransferase
MQIAVERDDEGEIFKALVEALIAFNRDAAGVGRGEPVVVTVRDDDGTLRGGVWGRVSGDSAYFDVVFLEEPLRGQGRGRAMMVAAEGEARRRGAHDVWLYTLSWQARPFYEKLGYRCFAALPFMGGRHQRLFMTKDLGPL